MLELLKAAAQQPLPDSVRTEGLAMPDGVLGFSIVYAEPPQLEQERARLADLLEGDNFELFAQSEYDPEILVLQFPNLNIQQSADFLFAEAQDLNTALGTIEVVPDIPPAWQDVTMTPSNIEGIGDFFWSLCMSNATGPTDPKWARKLIRVPQAEAAHGVRGRGVIIAQPDTGVADHDELDRGVDKANGANILTGSGDPTDPLTKDQGSPGHGTGTSSVAMSRSSLVVEGTATGASLIPIRAMTSVIIGDGRRVARALDHAVNKGAHIATMSLGGPFSGSSLRKAIVRAVNANMIVLAAAGNCVRGVTYPARDPNVIAVAGVDHTGSRWRGSCFGSAVDIAAPGENVFVARRQPVDSAGQVPTAAERGEVNARGQGTSFAVALTAGVAALWLEKFGHANILQEARRRRLSVHHFFRHALQSTAQKPNGWDFANMGEGIVDAETLLNTPLTSLPEDPVPVESASPALAAFGQDFNETPFRAEAAFIATDWSLREEGGGGVLLESPVPAIPSSGLATHIGQNAKAPPEAPAAIAAPATPPLDISDSLAKLAVSNRSGLESAASISTENAFETIRTVGPSRILTIAENALSKARENNPSLTSKTLQDQALRRIDMALQSVLNTENDPGMGLQDRTATLEALVQLTGRPAIRVRDDGSEVTDHRLGDWQGVIVPTRNRWQRLTKAVGRIDIELPNGLWVHAGTGFLLSGDIIMTNRHVLDTFAEPIPATEQTFFIRHKARINFDPEAKDAGRTFEITEIVSAGAQRIGQFVDLGKLDMALLRVNPDNGGGTLPTPLPRQTISTTSASVTDILVAGYPAKPRNAGGLASDDPDFLPFWDRLEELYGEEYGKKFMSPGKIMARPGAVVGDAKSWAFTHDATTLPGNSGSGIIALHDEMEFCGLHFGGAVLTQNYAHDIDAVFADGDGTFDPQELRN